MAALTQKDVRVRFICGLLSNLCMYYGSAPVLLTRKIKFESYFKNSYKRRRHLPFRSRRATRRHTSCLCGLRHILLGFFLFSFFQSIFCAPTMFFFLIYPFLIHYTGISFYSKLLLRSVRRKKKKKTHLGVSHCKGQKWRYFQSWLL